MAGGVKLLVAGVQLRSLRTAVQALARIGAEMTLEAFPESLVLRSLNSSKSAYLKVEFPSYFFDRFDMFEPSRNVKAGVHIKHLLVALRSSRTSRLMLDLDQGGSSMLIGVDSENGLRKDYRINLLDTEVYQTSVDRDALPVRITTEAAELGRLLSSFQQGLDEITVQAHPEGSAAAAGGRGCKIHSFFDPTRGDAAQALHTDIDMDQREVFSSYKHTGDAACEVTFNLKDFKTIVNLCTAMECGLALHFECAGQPLVATPFFEVNQKDLGYTAELVLATLLEAGPEPRGADDARTASVGRTATADRTAWPAAPPPAGAGAASSGFEHSAQRDSQRSDPVDRGPRHLARVADRAGREGRQRVANSQETQDLRRPREVLLRAPSPPRIRGADGELSGDNSEEDEVPSTPPEKRARGEFGVL